MDQDPPSPTPAAAPAPLADVRRILVRGVNWLGDAVMTTPALLRLRERFPEARIALLAPAAQADLWRDHPAVDLVLPLAGKENPRLVGLRLRGESFDLAVVLPNSVRAALETWWAHIPRRIGYARPWRNFLLTHKLPARPGHFPTRKRPRSEIRRLKRSSPAEPPPPAAHQIHDYLHLVSALGANPEPLAPRLELAPAELERARQSLLASRAAGQVGPPGGPPLLGLIPGAEYGPAKRWPAENFAAVARAVARRLGACQWVACGSAADWRLCRDLAGAAGVDILNLAGRTSLRELMAVLKLCRVVLTNDTGPMHVAAALGTPVVALFGSTEAVLTAPGLPGVSPGTLFVSDAGCAPCFRRVCPINLRCLTRFSVAEVSEAVLRQVQRADARG